MADATTVGVWARNTGILNLARSAGGLAAGRGAAALLSGAWLIVAARILPLSAFGDLAVLLALGAIFTTVSDGGTLTILAQDTARRGHLDRELLRRVFLRRSLASAVATAALLGLYLLAASDKDPVVPLLFGLSILASAAYGSVLSAYRALGHVAYESLNELVSRIAVLAVGWFWLSHGGGLRAAAATYAGADILSALIVVPVVWRRFGSSIRGLPLPSVSLSAIFPFILAGGLVVIYYRVDTYLVGLIAGSRQAALYGAAYKILDGCLIPALAVEGVVMAATARLSGRDKWRAGRRLVLLAGAMTLAPVIIGVALAGPIMGGLFGTRFLPAAPILQLLLVSAVPAAAVAVLVPITSITSPYGYAVASGVALVLNVGLNVLLIPRYGGLGAASVNIATQVALAAIFIQILRRKLRPVVRV